MPTKKNLVIVESPAKAKTIEKHLGSSYKVVASMGHLRDLPKSKMGVDIENNFEPTYITVRGKGELLGKLKKQAKSADKVYLATDPDREGEAISWHLSHVLAVPEGKISRITFNEITKTAIKNALNEARDIDQDLVDAQQARRILDRVVGYSLSPFLWRKVKKGLSGGRVQSVATDMIVRRQREIDAFVPQEYWTIDALFKEKFTARFHEKPETEAETNDIIKSLSSANWIVKSVKKSEKKRNPAPPFITSTLQQEGSRKLNFQSRKTMQVAQQLYESGLITYMRTDSLRISSEAQDSVRKFIAEEYGADFLPKNPRVYKTKKNAQDAHEAIRPTDVNKIPKELGLEPAALKLYRMIWERFVASQMESAVLDTISADIEANGRVFRASGSKVKFAGFMKVYVEGTDDDEKDDARTLPDITEGQKLNLSKLTPEQHFTAPPPSYTEATLIKAMEEEGIGRPSTYAPTISTILARGYISRDGKALFPTELGVIVTELMEQFFEKILDVKFTAGIEEQLDSVEEGKREWTDVLKEFYPDFAASLDRAEQEIGHVELKDEESDVPCDKCGRMMVFKLGKFGKFLACPGFPECRNTKPIITPAGVDCPMCGAKVLVKKSKRGKIYYGCEKNKEGCDFMSWDKPTGAKCKKCDSAMIEKKVKGGKVEEVCSNKECK